MDNKQNTYVPLDWILSQLISYQHHYHKLRIKHDSMSMSFSSSSLSSLPPASSSSTALIPMDDMITPIQHLMDIMTRTSHQVTSHVDTLTHDMDQLRISYGHHLIHMGGMLRRWRYHRIFLAWYELSIKRQSQHHMYQQAVAITYHRYQTGLVRYAMSIWEAHARRRQRVKYCDNVM